MFFKSKIDLDKTLKFESEIELNMFVRDLIDNKIKNNLRLELIVESLLRSLIYYVYSSKDKENNNLRQVLEDVKQSKEPEKNKDCFINKVEKNPIDHPMRLYWNEVSKLPKDELNLAFDKIIDILSK